MIAAAEKLPKVGFRAGRRSSTAHQPSCGAPEGHRSALARRSWASTAQKRRFARGLDLVEERLAAVASEYPGALGEACRATLAAGGKRVRPLLTLLCARSGAAAGEPVLRAAAAVELLHMATLVHDDVLDRAELRRGRPTVAHQYGVAAAVSAGNYLLARAFSELVGAGDPAAVDLLSATAVGLSEGEVLQRAEAHDVRVGVGGLRAPLRAQDRRPLLGGLRARRPALGRRARRPAAVGEYGRLIGLAFQVFDDILDCSGDEATTGKRPGTDVRDGTITLPLIYALEVRPELAESLRRPDLDAAEVGAVLHAVIETAARSSVPAATLCGTLRMPGRSSPPAPTPSSAVCSPRWRRRSSTATADDSGVHPREPK